MTGIIEYGSPEVRKEYVRRIEEMFKSDWARYEGMFMYSFIENTEAHYTDEYIYSDYAMQDFKKRYGVDVRTQKFDLDKYYAILFIFLQINFVIREYHAEFVLTSTRIYPETNSGHRFRMTHLVYQGII
jgi:hypothetical protein